MKMIFWISVTYLTVVTLVTPCQTMSHNVKQMIQTNKFSERKINKLYVFANEVDVKHSYTSVPLNDH
jgi:ribosomal protein L13